MPGKRNQKGIDQSNEISATSNLDTSVCKDASNGGEISSSNLSSVESENEEAIAKTCCLLLGCPYGEEMLSPEHLVVKLTCSSEACTMSKFMHEDCFENWEEMVLSYLKVHSRNRSSSERRRGQTEKGRDLAYRACMCKCKKGYLRKDLDWKPATSISGSELEENGKKKNRRGFVGSKFNGIAIKTKSKPIPNHQNNGSRNSSASSTLSLDQGYGSISPNKMDMGPYAFSPPCMNSRSLFSYLTHRTGNGLHIPSTSPLPEVPDHAEEVTSPHDNRSFLSPSFNDVPDNSMFKWPSPTFSPEKETGNASSFATPIFEKEIPRFFSQADEEDRKDDLEMTTCLIDNFRFSEVPGVNNTSMSSPKSSYSNFAEPSILLNPCFAPQSIANNRNQRRFGSDIASAPGNEILQGFPRSMSHSAPVTNRPWNHRQMVHQKQAASKSNDCGSALASASLNGASNYKRGNFHSKALSMTRRPGERETESKDFNSWILSKMSDETKTQVIVLHQDQNNQRARTEIRLIPMRSTKFAKRYDFSLFEEVLPPQHVNPYRVKMEGEGHGSDDLRNCILSCLSKARCSKMNCAVCGVDMPVYDHFPLVEGTMFLSPERNEDKTQNCFKIKIESKCEYVHAVCIRCLEGLHNVVCRMCNARWEGVHHQLGTLYMYDIFAASPCCQRRLCCKQCGSILVDIRQGLTFFGQYSELKTCSHCHSTDYHFVRPVSSYHLVGLVFS